MIDRPINWWIEGFIFYWFCCCCCLLRFIVRWRSVCIDFTAVRCDDGWINFRESCYLRVNTKTTWSNAQKTCEEKEANLVTVNSKDEMEFLGWLMRENGGWNGLQMKEDGKTLVWSSGEKSDYQNWGKGGPKRKSKLLRCVQMATKRKGLKWTLSRCSIKYKFTCEKGW